MRNKGRSVAVPSTQTPGTKPPGAQPGKKPPKIWKGPGPKGSGPKGYGQGGKKPGPQVGSNDPGTHKKGGRGGGGRPGGASGGNYGAMGDYPGVRYGDAAALVNAGLKPEINQVQNDIQKTRRETQRERQRADRQYNAAVGDIGHIYGETGDYINYQNQQIDQNYTGLAGQTQTAQAALMQHLQSNDAAAQTGANAEISRLGIEGMPYTQTMQQDAAFTNDQATISGANNMANLDLAHQNSQELGNLLTGMNAGSQTAAYGRAANAKSDALFEAEANKHTATEQLLRSLQDLRSQRPDLIRQMMEQMQQSKWGQYMDTQNLGLQQDQLGLQREQLNLQRAAQRAYNKRSSSYSSSSGYTPYGTAGSSGGSGSGSASAKPDGNGPSGYAGQVVKEMGGMPKPKPKPGKKH